eukprot:5226696-Amphidinium_carterae.2
MFFVVPGVVDQSTNQGAAWIVCRVVLETMREQDAHMPPYAQVQFTAFHEWLLGDRRIQWVRQKVSRVERLLLVIASPGMPDRSIEWKLLPVPRIHSLGSASGDEFMAAVQSLLRCSNINMIGSLAFDI